MWIFSQGQEEQRASGSWPEKSGEEDRGYKHGPGEGEEGVRGERG